MSTTTTAPKHKSFLSEIGGFFTKFFHASTTIATAAEPFVDLAEPGLSALYNSTVALVANAEMTAAAVAPGTKTGPQKLSMVLSALTPIATSYLAANKITVNETNLTNYVNAVVASLNALPPTVQALLETPAAPAEGASTVKPPVAPTAE